MPVPGQKLQPKTIPTIGGVERGIHKISPSLLHMAVAIQSLKFDPMNARLHPEKNLAAIKQSLSTFGQVKPIVVRKSTRVIVAGNGTTEAAKGLGWTHIAATLEDMTDVEATSFGLADNRTAELAKWDYEIVAALEALITEQRSVMIGWTSEELDLLKAADWTPPNVGNEDPYEMLQAIKFTPVEWTAIQRAVVICRERHLLGNTPANEVLTLIVREWESYL